MMAAKREYGAAGLSHTLKGRAMLRIVLLACLLTMTQGAWADRFLQEPGNFTAIVQGIDRIRFTLPTQYDGVQNEGIVEGIIYVSENGGEKKEFLKWGLGNGYNDLTSDSESGKITLRVTYDGQWQLVGKVLGGHKYFQKNSDVTFTVGSNDDDSDHFTTTVDWTVPRELRGKRFTFHLWCKSEASRWTWYIPDGNKDKSSTYQMGDWDCPAAAEVSIELNEPMLSYDANQAGSFLFPYTIQAKSVTEATIYYTDAITGTNYSKVLSSKLVDMTNLPADRQWKDIQIKAKLKDSENKDVSISSNIISSKMMHFPKDLTAKIQPNGEVLLTWKVDNANLEDFDDSDNFEVQRNVDGNTDANDGGWTTIAMEDQFVLNKDTYTFLDKTLLDRYKDKNVAYRVRRSATSLWKWNANSLYTMRVIPAALALPGFANAFVQRTDTWNDEEHIVKFSFANGPKYDNEGRFIIRNDADWDELQQMVRSGKTDYGKAVMVLMDENDWNAFAQRVRNGANSLNAVMLSDIDIQNSHEYVGSDSSPFRGTFNGMGSTLTVSYKETAGWYCAPFSHVGDATIQNLGIAGTITSGGKFIGGLIGQVKGKASVDIDRCVVTADIVSQIDGDGSSGGLIGIMEESSRVNIRNSAFTGSILGDKTNSNGGFIGVALEKTSIRMANCLFSPASVPFDKKGCKTFARADATADITLDNCYYTMVYGMYENQGKSFFVLQTEKDWTAFSNMVADGQTVNAILYTDITITDMVGSESNPFTGIFDGNGHTITLNIKTSNSFTAPFSCVGDAEIKNVTVNGSLEGGIHSSGLVGASINGKNVSIDNVHVSAAISTVDKYAGGFVGHGEKANITITNSRFDGTITVRGGSPSYAGAFIGWEENNTNNTITNCYENGKYVGIDHAGMNYYNGGVVFGNNGRNQNNYSAHNWGEMGDTKYKEAADNSSLAAALGKGWTYKDGKAMPVMTTAELESEGKPAGSMTTAELRKALGDGDWSESGDGVRPVMNSSTDNSYGITLWDKRAKLLLYVKMKGQDNTETNIVDISGNEDAIQKHEFTYNLTRKCVEYDFELVVKRGTSPLRIAGSTADSIAQSVTKKDVGELANYKFMNMNQITGLTAQKKQSSVKLEWTVSGGECDYYRLLRRKHSKDENAEWTDTIANNLVQQFYEDKDMQIQQAYDYRVESILQCEGLHIARYDTLSVECVSTGRVSGYIRMADGTAMAGVVVTCTPDAGIKGADAVYKDTTDVAGFFEFKELPYQTNGKYYISVAGGGFTGPNTEGEVIFSPNSNWTQNFNFFMDNYYVYSGNVFYRDTSIPVPGVSFKLDGNVMHDASQQVITTDTQGAFSLSIPSGAHRVQAVKDGHYFAADGFLINPDAREGEDKTLYNFQKNVSEAYIWDSTTVVLRGRVVGGDTQGELPLGQSLSVNNLGDSLKIVMQLEGDNASYLIRKQDDETVKSASYKLPFGLDNRDTTQVYVTRHTMTVRPDNETGEFQLELHPAKYKVIEVSAQGYATLFQQGKVGETLDLTFNVRGDTCVYNRIYHALPTLDVRQFNVGDEPYYGVKKVTASDNIGNHSLINTWYWKKTSPTDSIGVYSLDYPVFMANSPYGWTLQACEKYYYNNNVSSIPDIVNLKSGKVTIKNGLVSATDSKDITLDEDGGASYVFTPQNTTFLMTGDNALKGVSITLEYDNSFFDVKPLNGEMLQGYVMATMPKAEGRKSVVSGIPQLVDILRDPPGGGSSAYLEAGSKLSYSYNADLNGSAGMTFSLTQGNNANFYNGTTVVPNFGTMGTEAGTFTDTSKKNIFNIDAVTYYSYGWNFSYNFDVTERIQTLGSKKWIGGKADLFMGMTTDVMIEDAIAVRVVPDSIWQIYKTHEGGTFKAYSGYGNTTDIKVPTGTAKLLVEGVDDTGKPIYLIRDEVMAVGPKLKSTFIHSQNYIENELVPDLIKVRNALILPMGTSPDYAKALANKKKHPTYVSKVPENDVRFGYIDSYVTYDPDEGLHGDSILALNQTIEAWLYMLSENERKKIEVSESDLVKRYDFDGGTASIQYSETFTATRTENRSLRYPGINDLGQVTEGILSSIQTFIKAAKHWNEINGKNVDNKPYQTLTNLDSNQYIEIKAGGSYLSLKINPVITLNFTDKSGMTKTDSKKIGFTLSAASKSSLTVDVYRTGNEQMLVRNNYYKEPFTGGFGNITIDMLDMLRTGKLGSNPMDYLGNSEKVYSSFVYRTRGGVTCQPYEGERKTKWYQPGTVIDVTTIPADKPTIWIDEPVVSNVPFDEPARFTLHFANESEFPDRATLIFNYYLLGSSNPNGAKVYIDGTPINSGGVNIVLYPCRDENNEVNIFTKQIEVYPGEEFDYNDLTLCLYDPDDPSRVFSCKFSAHFVPAAGKVNISSPSDKWVVNTESSYDGLRKAWYMPVKIDGFNVNHRGFDHIELQYKLSTQGEKDWVNVCSYYVDKELMAKASGVTDTIPDNGTIIAAFYGETDPIEQYYDLRAVNYCRHGNGFLTRSSQVLTGIKDTRLPIAFGTPEPTDGILDIGDDIKVKFSEPIAANYLRNINNFEVLGTLNSNDISTSTSLSFDQVSYCMTQGERNLTGKSFTVDIMVNPAAEKRAMTIFSHGGEEKGLKFGISEDRHLTATIYGQKVQSDSVVAFNNALHQVAYALDQSGDDMIINFFDGCKPIGSKELTGKYEGVSSLILGLGYDEEDFGFKGEMLEFRLWNRAMTENSLDNYGKKKLTGYESGLLDYYPLNEGEGTWGYDKGPGSMDLVLVGTSWKRPNGISMEMKGDKGLRLKPDQFMRSTDHDYTLMFWFKTKDMAATLFSNGEALRGQENEINIGVKDYELYVRSNGFEKTTWATVCDGAWHHFAMTVNRSQNVANIYLDKKLYETFPADSLSGISADHIALGATYKDKNTVVNPMKGYIDEVGMFSSVLPVNLIMEYANHTPIGTMSALMAYLNFEHSEKLDNNMQHLEPTGISLKRYVDNQGKVLERRDTLVAQDIVEALAARDTYAPMKSSAQLDNLNYSFSANNNELYIDITEPDYMVEKTNIYITIKDVPDLQGNLMASPITMDLYIYQNPLRWDVKRIETSTDYGSPKTFEATIRNLSGIPQNFRLEDLPVWLTASQTQGFIGALDEQRITFQVSGYMNVGIYNEQLALVGDNNMSEPLPITLRVNGELPDWNVSDQLKLQNQTMMMVARVKIDGVVASSKEDIVAVFDDKQQVLGRANIEVNDNASANEALVYLTIYGYKNTDGTFPTLNFRFYEASNGRVYELVTEDESTFTFQSNTIVGSATDPVILENNYNHLQKMELKKGWNWVTFNVEPFNDFDYYYSVEERNLRHISVGKFLNRFSKWEPGDKITTANGSNTQQYTCREDRTAPNGYRWDNEDQPIDINLKQMYSIYSMSDKTVYLEGYFVYEDIVVHKDWNRIAYFSSINLPIAQALADYTEKAHEGDVVKSQDGFAIASRGAAGDASSLVWKGSLQYMETGKGYMLKRQADNEVSFWYPAYFNNSRYGNASYAPSISTSTYTNTISTMNIVAAVEGVDTEEGDRLVVFCGAERMAEAIADDEQNYYLNIGSDAKEEEMLSFAIERDGKTIAMTGGNISYVPNKVMGTPDNPTAINFTSLDQMPHDGKWYTVSGIMMDKKPAKSGLYIHNGQVVVIK